MSRQVLRHLCASASAASASWGWVQSAPPKESCRKLDALWKEVGSRLKCASPHLSKLLCGHNSDLGFAAGIQLFSAL